jgi:hypothetical protein
MLPKRGNSKKRKELLNEYKTLIGINTISAFMADR